MAKRAKVDNRRNRQKDKMRKRRSREQQEGSCDVPPDETTESVDLCGSTDGAVLAGLWTPLC